MNKCCRTCREYEKGLCYHPDMMTEEYDIYTEYVEQFFDMGEVDEAVEEEFDDRVSEDLRDEIIATIRTILKNNLPVGAMHFSPRDDREFYCKFWR